MTGVEPTEDDQLLDRAIAVYTQSGFSRELMLSQLARRYTFERLRTRFPDISPELFPAPLATAPAEPSHQALPKPTLLPVNRQQMTPLAELAPAMLPRLFQAHAPNGTAAALGERALTSKEQGAVLTGDGISFQYVPLIQCSFPHTDPGEVTTFSRRNGRLRLSFATANAEVGLPYGVPARLLTIYLCSEATVTRQAEIYLGDSLNSFLRRLDVPITRGDRGSLQIYSNQLLRLIHCSVSIREDLHDGRGRIGLDIENVRFIKKAQLWWDRDYEVGQGSTVVLPEDLFESILERCAPLSTKVLKQLRKSPMDLDVYAWLVHRLFRMAAPSQVTWAQLSDQFGHSYGDLRYFRRFFLTSLERVRKLYPQAQLRVNERGLMLLPSRPHISHQPTRRSVHT